MTDISNRHKVLDGHSCIIHRCMNFQRRKELLFLGFVLDGINLGMHAEFTEEAGLHYHIENQFYCVSCTSSSLSLNSCYLLCVVPTIVEVHVMGAISKFDYIIIL